jgi:hypothetical protein
MYHVELLEVGQEAGSWGEFAVIKGFEIHTTPLNRNTAANASHVDQLITKMSKLGLNKSPKAPCGFIVQHVTKKTVVRALCAVSANAVSANAVSANAVSTIKKIENIDDFTSNKVKYMNGAYYELFPVLDGKATENDSFANGAVLRYEKDKRTWYANNNPPTKGTIHQEGTIYFIPEDKHVVEQVMAIMEKSTRKRSPVIVPILGINWDLNPQSPANGMPYTEEKIGDILESMRKSNTVLHTVIAEWNGIGSLNNNKNKTNTSVCHPIKETNNESNKRTAPTQLKITVTPL